MRIFTAFLFSALMLPLSAQNKSSHPGFHQHDGFYLSLSLGGNKMEINNNDRAQSIMGKGTAFDFKIGGTILKNLLLHVSFVGSAIKGPTINDSIAPTISVSDNMAGIGLTYYIMPINFFLSASAGASGFTYYDTDPNRPLVLRSKDKGPSYQLKIGKEWWVSKNWGLGISVAYHGTVVEDTGLSGNEKITAGSWAILFNSTFN